MVDVHRVGVLSFSAITSVVTRAAVLVVAVARNHLAEVVLAFDVDYQLLGHLDPALEVIALRGSDLHIKGLPHTPREPLPETADPSRTVPIAYIYKIGILGQEVGKRSEFILL